MVSRIHGNYPLHNLRGHFGLGPDDPADRPRGHEPQLARDRCDSDRCRPTLSGGSPCRGEVPVPTSRGLISRSSACWFRCGPHRNFDFGWHSNRSGDWAQSLFLADRPCLNIRRERKVGLQRMKVLPVVVV